MSVINKMLRDLDSRQPVADAAAPTLQSLAGMTRGTQVVDDSDPVVRGTRPVAPAALTLTLLLAMSALASVLYFNHIQAAPEDSVSPLGQGGPAAGATPLVAVATPSSGQPEVKPAPVASGRAASAVVLKTPSKAPPVVEKQRNPKPDSVPDNAALRWAQTLGAGAPIQSPGPRTARGAAMAPVSDRLASGGGGDSAAGVSAPAQGGPRLIPGLEALAQAQSLWGSGKHNVAIDVLQEALVHAERSNMGKSPSSKDGVLSPIVRELARMKLAEGRVSETLEMLTRLELPLADVADVWGLRGNAAQRLGRHQESVNAYLRALALRPEEARWKLGAAVSLAAQGQTAGAADLAEEARASGAVSSEVALYLRQLGVPLRER